MVLKESLRVEKILMNKQQHALLEALYKRYHRAEYIHPDPLQFLGSFPEVKDREIIGLLVSSFSYGQVGQIIKTCEKILAPMQGQPHEFILQTSPQEWIGLYQGFQHRWHVSEDLVGLLAGIRHILKKFGSIESCMLAGADKKSFTLERGLNFFVDQARAKSTFRKNLLPAPEQKSACKRLLMYCRWMIRCDEVDPGGWDQLSPSQLIIPLDTHMHRFALNCGFTKCQQANWKAALEVTRYFKKIAPQDPLRYEFAITRLGIHPQGSMKEFIQEWVQLATSAR